MSLVLSVKVRRTLSQDEWLWQNVDNSDVIRPTFGFKIHSNFKFKNRIIEKFAPPYTSPRLA